MVAGAVSLSELTIQLDLWWARLDWPVLAVLSEATSETALLVLSAVMGLSTLVLLVLILSLALAVSVTSLSESTQHPALRVLRSFLAKPGARMVFGIFLGTAAFALTTLYNMAESHLPAFVPQASMLTGILMTLAGLGMMVLYFHRSAPSFQLQVLIDKLGGTLVHELEREYGHPAPYPENEAEILKGYVPTPLAIPSQQEGYIQKIDAAGLTQLAQEYDLVLRLQHDGSHDFAPQEPLVQMYHKGASSLLEDGDLVHRINRCIRLGSIRQVQQDPQLAMDQLVEIALKSLSRRGRVSTLTLACIDWLGCGLSVLVQNPNPSPYRRDSAGRVRMIRNIPPFETWVDGSFQRLRQNAGSIPEVSLSMLARLGELVQEAVEEEYRTTLHWHAVMIERGKESMARKKDRHEVHQAFRQFEFLYNRVARPTHQSLQARTRP